MLRYWRQLRSKSQMDLALDIDISTRHLSFVETGKSRPGRDLLLKLADALRIPLRQRNLLLQLAGYSDEYREEALDSSRMAALQSATTRILENHEPFPALVINASYDILQVNNGAQKMLSYFMKGGPR
jgi:transcriptional regulator with XRE-family HTH domain